MKNKQTIIRLVFIAVYAALAVVLDYVSQLIPFLQMPNGGSIELELIPIFIASYHLGVKDGAITGFMWWAISFVLGLNSYYLTFIQYILDYFIPFIIIGFASAMPRIWKISNIYTGITITMIIKYISQTLSGVYFWFPETTYAGSIEAWIYSAGYNLWYNLATMIVCLIIVPVLIEVVKKGNKTKFIGVK